MQDARNAVRKLFGNLGASPMQAAFSSQPCGRASPHEIERLCVDLAASGFTMHAAASMTSVSVDKAPYSVKPAGYRRDARS